MKSHWAAESVFIISYSQSNNMLIKQTNLKTYRATIILLAARAGGVFTQKGFGNHLPLRYALTGSLHPCQFEGKDGN